jgi:prevent-host-death family protein
MTADWRVFPNRRGKAGEAHPEQWHVRDDRSDTSHWGKQSHALGSTPLAGRRRRVVTAIPAAVVLPCITPAIVSSCANGRLCHLLWSYRKSIGYGVHNPVAKSDLMAMRLCTAHQQQAIASLDRVRYTRRMKTIHLSAFQAQCLALVEEVAKTGEPVTILQHGTPVAQLVPSLLPSGPSGPYAQMALLGTVRIHGDIEAPVLPPEAWEAEGPSHP